MLTLLSVAVSGTTLTVAATACGGDQREMRQPSVDQTTTSLVRGTTTTVFGATTTTPTTITTSSSTTTTVIP